MLPFDRFASLLVFGLACVSCLSACGDRQLEIGVRTGTGGLDAGGLDGAAALDLDSGVVDASVPFEDPVARQDNLCAALLCDQTGGRCALDPNGDPHCVCPSGWLATEDRCLKCAVPGTPFEVPGTLVELRARVTINGVLVNSQTALVVKSLETGAEVRVAADGQEMRYVPPGRYSVSYAGSVAEPFVSAFNQSHPLGSVDISENATLSYDLRATRVVGSFDLGPDHELLSRNLSLAFVEDGGFAVGLTGIDRRRFETVLLPGVYRIALARPGELGLTVGDYDTLVVSGNEGLLVRDIEIPTARIAADLSLEGPPASMLSSAQLYVYSSLSQYAMRRLPSSNVFELYLPTGDFYTVAYGLLWGTDRSAPLQLFNYDLARFVLTEDRGVIPARVNLRQITGTVQIGAMPLEPNRHRVILNSTENGRVVLRINEQGSFSEWVPSPGRFLLQYQCLGQSCDEPAGWPANSLATFALGDLFATSPLAIDIPTVRATISVRENGALISEVDPESQVSIRLENPALTQFWRGGTPVEKDGSVLDTRIIPGTYNVAYLRRQGKQVLRWTVDEGLDLSFGENTKGVDLNLITVRGRLGMAEGGRWKNFSFERPGVGFVNFETEPDGTFEVQLRPGSYLLRGAEQLTVSNMRDGTGTFGCFTFCTPGQFCQ